MAQVLIHLDNGDLIDLVGTVTVADGVLHVSVTGATKRVRHGRQWVDEPQPGWVDSFPLIHVLRWRTDAVKV